MPVTTQTAESVQPRRPRGRPKSEDLAALEARLVTVGRELFFRHGYGATTMSEVASAARVSKTTLYSRFPAKAALFRAMVAEQIQSWDTGINHTPVDHAETLQDLLLAYGDVVLRAGTSSDFIQLDRLLYSESGRFPELAEIAAARFRLGVDYLAGQIESFAARERAPCRNAASAAELYLMMLTGSVNAAVLGDRTVTAAQRRTWLENAVRVFIASRASW